MKEEPPTPLDPGHDASVEARIVAWVLGEASTFEVAELERLCEERPELLVFRRRMRELHGLLTEAEAAEPDLSWQLPAEKRRILDDIFGEEKVDLPAPLPAEPRIKRGGFRMLFALAACVAISLFVIRLEPWKYEAEVVLELKPQGMGMTPLDTEMADSRSLRDSRKMSPQFFATEFDRIKSRKSLEKVVEKLDLSDRWEMDKETAVRRLSDSTVAENTPGADVIRIKVRDASENSAKEIAREIAYAYKADREEIEARDAEKGLAELNKAVRDQEDKVEESRKLLATIAKTKGVIYRGSDSYYGDSGADEDSAARSALQTFNQLQKDKMQLESQLNGLLKIDSEQLMVTAAGLDLPDNVVKSVYPQYLEAQRSIENLKHSGLSDNHPDVIAAAEQAKAMKRQMNDGIVTLRETLKTKLNMAQDSLKSVAAMKEESREDGITRSLAGQDYVDAKRELESNQRLLESMKLKKIGAETTLKMTGDSVVIHEEPELLAANSKPSSTAFQVAPSAPQKSRDFSFMRTERQQRLASRSAPQNSAAPGSVALPEIADAKKMESIPTGSDPFADSAGALLGSTARQPRPRVVPPSEFKAGDSVPAGAADSFSNRELAEQTRDKNPEPASAPPVLSAKQPASPTAPESALKLSELAQREVVRRQNAVVVDAVLSDPGLESKQPANPTAPESADTPFPSTTALADGDHQKVDQVGRNLYVAEGNYNLGKYDDAKKAYEEVLKADANNSAARRGLEKLASARTDYYRAAYDHTRAELLSQTDSAWELPIPKDGNPDPAAKEQAGPAALALGTVVGSPSQPGRIEFNDNVSPATGGVAPEDLETLNRLGMKGLAFAEDQSMDLYGMLVAGVEQGIQKEGELTKNAEDVWPSHLGKLSEIEELNQDEKDLNKLAQRTDLSSLPDLMAETLTSENPYSTFSLNISDASFQLAKASLAKGERPDPASIKPEQFYNAVDYGDPAPSANEPVAATIEQTAHPIIPGRNLVRVALRTGSVGRSAAQPLRLTLLVDQSGSMAREDRRAAMEQALAQLGTLLTKADLVTVIGFSRTPHLLADGMTGDQAAKLGELVNQTASEGGTNLEEAMKLGAQLAARHQLAGAQNRIVLFTDGAANLGDAKPERLAEQVKELRQKGISFDIAGIGADGLNDRLLSELARNGNGRYYVVSNERNDSFARQLAGAFRPAAENVKIQVIFNPQRVGKYKLIGFEKDRLKTEDFRNDTVDAAELAADEAGVAIYQVEPIAEGRGELGEISVRFRDAGSGEMVERGWTIPYDTKVTAFDRATPSMRLAGLSMLAAEKLRGGPLATATDFNQLSGSTAFVKQFYGSSPRISDMLQVIEALK